MPGIIGYAGNDASETLLEDMAQALDSDARFRRDLHTGQGYGLGRVSLGIVNPESQPIWSDDRSCCLVMEGEFYNSAELAAELQLQGHASTFANDAELALAIVRWMGIDGVKRINGAFVLALWDAARQRLVIVNDRLGLYPLYYAVQERTFLFSSGMRSLLQEPSLSRSVDRVTMAEFLTFDHALGQRTLLESVTLMEQGAILTFEDGRVTLDSYWIPEHPQQYELRGEEEWADDLIDHLRQAVRRQVKDDLSTGLLLSGGLDSRVLLAILKEQGGAGGFRTFTWGIPGCDDAAICTRTCEASASLERVPRVDARLA